MAAPQAQKTAGRLAFIDWTRGLAAVIMLQGHTFNSFCRTDLRPGGAYMLSQFAGGLPPAIFLFLTGITFAFLMDSQERAGAPVRRRIWAAIKRSRFLFILAFLFRLQMYITGYPTSPATELLRVDILNCMGFAMLVFAPMAAFTTHERIRFCTVLGILVAGLAPVMTSLNGSGIPWLFRSYVFPDYNLFGFFPWAAYLAFGMAAGSILRVIPKDQIQRAMLWMLGMGAGTAMMAHFLSNLPYSVYPKSEFWLDSPGLIAIKTGFVLCLLAVAYLWTNLAAAQRPSLLRQLGTTSLLVYWVHVELVYGRWFGIWKEALSVPQVLLYTVALLALMTALSYLQTRYRSVGAFFQPSSVPQPQRVAGD